MLTHSDPVWRDRADFILGAQLPDPDSDRREQLWSRQVAPTRFEICCIPFFLYDVALADVVETGTDYTLERVVEASGRWVFRAWFGESFHPRDEIADELAAMGALLEWSSVNLLAVDASDAELAQRVAHRLEGHERRGHLIYETGRS
jgi:hypothetical protein